MASYLLNAPDEMLDSWRTAAKAKGLTLAEFLRRAGNYYAGGDVKTEKEQREAARVPSYTEQAIASVKHDLSDRTAFKPDFKRR